MGFFLLLLLFSAALATIRKFCHRQRVTIILYDYKKFNLAKSSLLWQSFFVFNKHLSKNNNKKIVHIF